MIFWDDMPPWLRWILYAPAVFGIALIPSTIFVFVNTSFLGLPGTTGGDFLRLLGGAFYTVVFAWLALNLAPRSKRIAAWTLFGAWSLVVALGMATSAYLWLKMGSDIPRTRILEILEGALWFVIGVFCLRKFSREVPETLS